LRRDKFIR